MNLWLCESGCSQGWALLHIFWWLEQRGSKNANNAINADSKKRRSFVEPLFAAGYGERYAA